MEASGDLEPRNPRIVGIGLPLGDDALQIALLTPNLCEVLRYYSCGHLTPSWIQMVVVAKVQHLGARVWLERFEEIDRIKSFGPRELLDIVDEIRLGGGRGIPAEKPVVHPDCGRHDCNGYAEAQAVGELTHAAKDFIDFRPVRVFQYVRLGSGCCLEKGWVRQHESKRRRVKQRCDQLYAIDGVR
jgi:hypothetical protein